LIDDEQAEEMSYDIGMFVYNEEEEDE